MYEIRQEFHKLKLNTPKNMEFLGLDYDPTFSIFFIRFKVGEGIKTITDTNMERCLKKANKWLELI
jgi:hypothetical protein